jgi:8-oxo-dGTP diphosphatase
VPHVQRWTAQAAVQLQAALRLSNEAFARKLGIAVRTVAKWRAQPDLVQVAEMQQILDAALASASAEEKARFFAQYVQSSPEVRVLTDQPSAAQTLTVAIAIVANDSKVLIVHRRSEDGRGISWQFPAGMVKPGSRPDLVAVRETYAETGVHCAPIRSLGSRVHPITNVLCEYILCEYLSGEPQNRDEAENVSVTWAPTDRLTRFIPVERIFPPVLDALGGTE